MDEFQQAFLQYLPTPLEQTTLGAAFKAMLEYQRDQKYDWANTDDIMFDITIDYGDRQNAGGLLGMFGLTKEGKPQAVVIGLSRVLDSFDEENDDQDDEEFDENSREEEVSLEFEYDISALGDIDPDEFDGFYEDSEEHESLEEYVKAVLENEVFVRLALLKPKNVQFLADNDIL